jgi:hypothetical protein
VFCKWYWFSHQSVSWELLSLAMLAYRANTSLQPHSVASRKIDLGVPIFFQLLFASFSLLYGSNFLWSMMHGHPA